MQSITSTLRLPHLEIPRPGEQRSLTPWGSNESAKETACLELLPPSPLGHALTLTAVSGPELEGL